MSQPSSSPGGWYGNRPSAHSNNVNPKLHMSLSYPYLLPLMRSGCQIFTDIGITFEYLLKAFNFTLTCSDCIYITDNGNIKHNKNYLKAIKHTDIYVYVPTNVSRWPIEFARTALTPKSEILTSPLWFTSKLEGLMSLWMICLTWCR